MKLLIFAPYGIGNLILLYPVLKTLKEKEIKFDIVSFLRTVDSMLENWNEFSGLYEHKWSLTGTKKEIISTIRSIRKERYDISLLSFPSAKPHYNILSFLCGAKKRIGSRYPDDKIFKTFSFLNNKAVPVEMGIHDVFQNVNLIKKAGIDLSQDEIDPVPLNIPAGKIIGFHLGCSAGGTYKRWPLPKWESLVEQTKQRYPDYTLRLFFGPDEKTELEYFQDNPHVEIMTNLSLSKLKETIAESSLFISNDSGLMHIASLVGVPGIAINGPSDEIRTGPFSAQSTVLTGNCPIRPCSHSFTLKSHTFHCPYDTRICLESVEVDSVIEQISTFLPR